MSRSPFMGPAKWTISLYFIGKKRPLQNLQGQDSKPTHLAQAQAFVCIDFRDNVFATGWRNPNWICVQTHVQWRFHIGTSIR